MKELLKGMIGVTVGASILPSVISGIGSSGMATGLRSATQNLVSVGFVGHTASLFKKVKW